MRRLGRIRLMFAVLMGFVPASAGPALAQSMDGSWCASDGRQITIAGTRVITPGGQRTTGAYSLRAFRFEVRDQEWQAGATIWMELKGADSVRVSTVRENQQGPPPHDLWRRCANASRLLSRRQDQAEYGTGLL